MTPVDIRDEVLRQSGVALSDFLGRSRSRQFVRARHDVAFRVFTETDVTLEQVASVIGRSDHTTAINSILQGARRRGRPVARVSDLRKAHADPVDWTKLAYLAAAFRERRGLTLDQAGLRCGVGRGEWRKVERGRSVSAGTVLLVCRAIGLDPLALLPAGRVSRKTSVENGHG